MQLRNFDQNLQSFSLIRIFTDYYLVISKTNAIPTKASIPYCTENSQIWIFDCTRDILQIHVR